MTKKGIKGKVVCEYLERFPKTGSLTLARKIYKENKSVFVDVEDARTRIRYYRGALGKKDRGMVADKQHFRVTNQHNPFNIPDAREIEKTQPYIFPYKNYDNVLLMSDLHIPFHDKRALELALEYGLEKKVNGILLLGDVCDHHAQSRFITDPRERDLLEEQQTTITILREIRKAFPGVGMWWKQGNHEWRYEAYMILKAPELLDIMEFSYEKIFHLDELDIKLIGDKQIIHYGDNLRLIHGHESPGSYSPVNPAKGIFNKTLFNVVTCHRHRSSEHSEADMNGKLFRTFSLGCMCSLRPEYAVINKWNLGFGHLRGTGDGGFDVTLKDIYVDSRKGQYQLL
jgi:hypothetical protein